MDIKFTNGLIPVITQDFETKEVLILSYMNEEAYKKTKEENKLYYYSRSRQELWLKGATSGNTQELVSLTLDCDGDALLAVVKQKGVACHTGEFSCFHNDIVETIEKKYNNNVIGDLYNLISKRLEEPKEGSYTNYLFTEGIDKILKKVGEESSEVIIAAKNNDKEELIYELSDLVYHSLVLMVNQGVKVEEIIKELRKREE